MGSRVVVKYVVAGEYENLDQTGPKVDFPSKQD